jgi:hypothetical protein
MKTLTQILKGYCNGDYSLNEMREMVNETMVYRGYALMGGKRYLRAMVNGEFVEVSVTA